MPCNEEKEKKNLTRGEGIEETLKKAKFQWKPL